MGVNEGNWLLINKQQKMSLSVQQKKKMSQFRKWMKTQRRRYRIGFQWKSSGNVVKLQTLF